MWGCVNVCMCMYVCVYVVCKVMLIEEYKRQLPLNTDFGFNSRASSISVKKDCRI